jgi:hypothetical protein
MEDITVSLILLFGSVAAFAGVFSAAPWVVTRKAERLGLVKLISPKPGDLVVDLGAGDGSVLLSVAEAFPEARCEGVEIAVLPWLIGRLWLVLGGKRYANVKLKLGDLFAHDISRASVVFCFLMPFSHKRLVPKFRRELKDDAIVVMEAWPAEGFEPKRTVKISNSLSLHIYEGRQFKGK